MSLAPVLKVSEVRAVAADTLWLSMCHQRDSIAFHFTWIQSWADVSRSWPSSRSALEPFSPRPHWGKLSTVSGEVLRTRFERLGDFERAWPTSGTRRGSSATPISTRC